MKKQNLNLETVTLNLHKTNKDLLRLLETKEREIANLRNVVDQVMTSHQIKMNYAQLSSIENTKLKNHNNIIEVKLERKKSKIKILKVQVKEYEQLNKNLSQEIIKLTLISL